MKKKSTLGQLFLQIWVSCTKYWLNFQEFPFSNRYRRLTTRPDLEPETKFPLLGHLACISTIPKWFSTPEAKVISLLLSLGILAHFPLIVGLHHSTSVLGYPEKVWRVEGEGVGYPSVPPSNFQPLANWKCTRPRGFIGRRVPGRPVVRVQCRQFVEVENSRG